MIRNILTALTLVSSLGAAQAAEPLQVKVYNADGNSFHVNSVVISGATEALVIDTGFTRAPTPCGWRPTCSTAAKPSRPSW